MGGLKPRLAKRLLTLPISASRSLFTRRSPIIRTAAAAKAMACFAALNPGYGLHPFYAPTFRFTRSSNRATLTMTR
jgi:hypothetical protein